MGRMTKLNKGKGKKKKGSKPKKRTNLKKEVADVLLANPTKSADQVWGVLKKKFPWSKSVQERVGWMRRVRKDLVASRKLKPLPNSKGKKKVAKKAAKKKTPKKKTPVRKAGAE